ncbi:MFS transporter [Prosthecomicrobium sp. N25]|uniref:MFS transporter n=1 Tax=Prosthecomicrobium sp. N25 TaxID=3129254 RepID=UPI0030769A52
MSDATGNRWLMLAVLFLARTAMAFQFQSIGAVAPLLTERYAIDFALLGTLVGLFMLPGVVIALPGGLLGQRFGDKPVAIVGLTLMILGGIALAALPSFGTAMLARAVSGIGGVLLTVVLTKMLIDWFAGHAITAAMALFVNSWPIGIGLSLVILPGVAGREGVGLALLVPVAFALCALVGLAAIYRSAPGAAAAGGPAVLRFRLSRREWLLTIAAGLVWTFYNVGFILLMTYGPSLLRDRGLALSEAGPITSLAMWLCALSVPLSGLLAQRSGSPNLFMLSGFAIMAVLVVLLAKGAPALPVFALFGLASGLPAGAIMALPSEGLKPENRAAGMGVFFSCYYAGMAGLIPVAGWVRDWSGDGEGPLFVAIAMMLFAAASLATFRLVQRGLPLSAEPAG